MTRDKPRHGTDRGYRVDGCHCPACRRAAARRYNVYKLRLAANGGNLLSVPVLGSQRRLRALMAIGWTRRHLAAQPGGASTVPILAGQRTTLHPQTAAGIRDLYDRLSMTPGPSERTRAIARAKGWPPPLAYDDDRIDDPDHQPRGWQHDTHDRAAVLHDLDTLGAGLSEVCRRLGTTHTALQKWCQRHHLKELYHRLSNREDGMDDDRKRGAA